MVLYYIIQYIYTFRFTSTTTHTEKSVFGSVRESYRIKILSVAGKKPANASSATKKIKKDFSYKMINFLKHPFSPKR